MKNELRTIFLLLKQLGSKLRVHVHVRYNLSARFPEISLPNILLWLDTVLDADNFQEKSLLGPEHNSISLSCQS